MHIDYCRRYSATIACSPPRLLLFSPNAFSSFRISLLTQVGFREHFTFDNDRIRFFIGDLPKIVI